MPARLQKRLRTLWSSPLAPRKSRKPASGKTSRSPMTKAPEAFCSRGLFHVRVSRSSVLGLGVHGLLRSRPAAANGRALLGLRARADVNLARLHRLGDLADELDRKHAIFQVRPP